MDVQFARQAHALLRAGALNIRYHESGADHHIDAAHVPAAVAWVDDVLAPVTA